MFQFFKRKEETPVEEMPQSRDSGVESLKTDDGGYLGPAAHTDDGLPASGRRNYQSTAMTMEEIPATDHLPRRNSTLNTANDPRGHHPSKGWEDVSDDGSVTNTTASEIKKEKCCNPDYRVCGCCYPYSCFGFSGDQRLVMMSVGVFAILVGLIVGIVLLLTSAVLNPRLCMTPECVVAAGEIISSLDERADPCTDFVQFTCGGWQKQHPVPSGSDDVDAFSITTENMYYKVKELLEAPKTRHDPRSVNLTKSFYKACANESGWLAAGVIPLIGELEKSGGFPMINVTWDNSTYSWIDSIVHMRRYYAADYLISLAVSYDSKNSSQFVLHVGEGYIPSPRGLIIANDTMTRKREIERIAGVAQILASAILKEVSEKVKENTSTVELRTDMMTRSDAIIDIIKSVNETFKVDPSEEGTEKSSEQKSGLQSHDNDTLIEFLLSQMSHKKGMQIRRHGSGISLDGIDPHSKTKQANLHSIVELQRQEEETNSGEKPTPSQAVLDIYELWNFIYYLANITTSPEKAKDQYAQYNPMTISELQEVTDTFGSNIAEINWLEFINSAFEDTNIKLTKHERIIVSDPEYLINLLRLVKITPKRVIANFLSYMLSLNMGEEVAVHGLRGLSMTKNIGRVEPRPWYDCSAKANMVMTRAVSYLYVREIFNKDSIKTAEDMMSNVHDAFGDLLRGTTWMDSKTRAAGEDKLNKMLQLVGYDPDTTNATAIDEDNSQVPNMSEDDHFSNILKLARHISNESLSLLRETPDRSQFSMAPVTINAAYSFSQNAMIIPAGILQSPFFRRNTVPALNYGALGVVIGHEISHGFDDSGREVDSNGNLRQWWTSASKNTYDRKAECFKEQYSRFPLPDDLHGEEKELLKPYKINGEITKGENIADNGGVQASWRAFQQLLREADDEHPRLPGLEHYSPEQLFFISFAQLWCTNYTPMGLKAAILVGVHSPGPFRVEGTFENIEAMRNAFRCDREVSDAFNQTCRLW